MEDLIKEVQNKYITLFPNRFIDTIDLTNPDSIKAINKNIDSIYYEVFINFSKSIISGEYTRTSIEGTIKDFLSDLYKDEPPTDADDPIIVNLKTKFQSLNDNIYAYLVNYRSFIREISKSYDYKDDNILAFNATRNKTINEHRLYDFFSRYVTKCIIIDFQLANYSSEKILFSLINTELFVSESKKTILNNQYKDSIEKIYNLILSKLKFFFKKKESKSLSYSKDGNIEIATPSNFTIYKELENYLKYLYNKDSFYPDSLEQLLKQIKEAPQNNVTSIIRVMRHISNPINKVPDAEKKMDEIIKLYSNNLKDIDGNSEYDNFALDSIQSFLLNCKFSWISKQPHKTIKDIDKAFKAVLTNNQDNSNKIKNFHPYEKIIEFYIDYIEKQFNTNIWNTDNEYIEDINSQIRSLKNYYNDFCESIDWCDNRKFFPFFLPYSEALDTINDLEVFTPSTFARPIDYKKLSQKKDEFKSKLQEIDIRFTFKKENLKLNKDKDEIKKKISFYEKRTYEILAIFTTIITFLFTTVNVFAQNSSLNIFQLISNTMGLGFILLLFCGIILLTTTKFIYDISWEDFKKTKRWTALKYSIPIYLLITGAAIYFQYSESKSWKETYSQIESNLKEKNKVKLNQKLLEKPLTESPKQLDKENITVKQDIQTRQKESTLEKDISQSK